MRWVPAWLWLLACLSPPALADCIPFTSAHSHIGETRCVTGKILGVQEGAKGVHYLDFCENYQTCTFTVVIFPGDLRHVGDIWQLKNKTVEIHGPVKEYDGRAEIILREARQLKGEAASIPPLSKTFDVERKGRYSAGRVSYPKSPRQASRKRQGRPVQTEETSDSAFPD